MGDSHAGGGHGITPLARLQIVNPLRPPGGQPVLDLISERTIGHQDSVINEAQVQDTDLVFEVVG